MCIRDRVIGIPEPKKGKLIIVSEENYKNADGKSKKRIINKNSDGIDIYFNNVGKTDSNIISENTKIYINGKLSTKEEMNKLNPENIETVNINKNSNNGKEEDEIRIQTK